MAKTLVTQATLEQWLSAPTPAVFLDVAFSEDQAKRAAALPLTGCAFLGGGSLPKVLADAAHTAGCLLMPTSADLEFDPYRDTLYDKDSLFGGFDPNDAEPTFKRTADFKIYEKYYDIQSKQERTVDLDVLLMKRLHDASIEAALYRLLTPKLQMRAVGVMGGHDLPRHGDRRPAYVQAAQLGLALTQAGFFVVTGGGPGAMEAANLGAYCAGFKDPQGVLDLALKILDDPAPLSRPWDWLKPAWAARVRIDQEPLGDASKRESVGIPTWYYGHEPPNVFATHIAKYFANSVREEGILGVALRGIVYIEGNGGTVQEIFQDTCQNYYGYSGYRSPMVLLGTDYWYAREELPANAPADRRKRLYPLLRKIAAEKSFGHLVTVADDVASVVKFIQDHRQEPV